MTVIELVSPSNKALSEKGSDPLRAHHISRVFSVPSKGSDPFSDRAKYSEPGRELYLTKQKELRWSTTHLVEIDLLRFGPHVLAVPEALVAGRFRYDYLVSVNRARSPRTRFEIYPRTVRQPLPRIRIPLAGDDPDVPLAKKTR